MSVSQLVRNWAKGPVSDQIYIDIESFHSVPAAKKAVFIAWLWSGKSQLAFRTLCDELSRAIHIAPPVLVVDAESQAGEEFLNAQLPLGDGLLFLYVNGCQVAWESGGQPAAMRDAVQAFLSSESDKSGALQP